MSLIYQSNIPCFLLIILSILVKVDGQQLAPLISLSPSERTPMSVTFGSPPLKRPNLIQFLNPSSVFVSSIQQCQHLSFGTQTISLQSTGFSLAMTFAFTGTAQANEAILDFGSSSLSNNIILQRSGSTGNLILSILPVTVTITQVFAQSTVYNLAIVYNNSTNQILIYVNGNIVQTTNTSALADRKVVNTFIGRSNTGTVNCFNGALFSLKIWNQVLNSTSVSQLAMNTSALTVTPQLTANDAFLQLVPGAITPNYFSASAYPQFGKNFIRFFNPSIPATSSLCQYVDFGSQLIAPGTRGFTASVTFRLTAPPTTYQRVFDFGSGANVGSVILYRGIPDNILVLCIVEQGTQYYLMSTTNPGFVLTEQNIFRLSYVYNPSIGLTGNHSFWLNGIQLQSMAAGKSYTDRTVSATYVGRSWWNTEICSNIDIFSLKTYNRVLNATEIRNDIVGDSAAIIKIYRNQVSDFVTSTDPPVINNRGLRFNGGLPSNCAHMNFGGQLMSLGSSGFSATVVLDGSKSNTLRSDWTCVSIPPNFTPVRVTSQGLVECMSTDNANCYWTTSIAACQSWVANPPATQLWPVTNFQGQDTVGQWMHFAKIISEAEGIFDIGDSTGANRIHLSRVRRTNELFFGYTVNWAPEFITITLPNSTLNRYRLGVVYDNSASQLSIWLNGTRVALKTVTTAGVNFFYTDSFVGRSTARIGQCFDGTIYSLNIYDRLLSAAEIFNDTLIEICEAGKWYNETTNECLLCANGFYKPFSGNQLCIECPNGASCSPSAFTCNPGFGANSTRNGCVSCGTSGFKSVSSNDFCTPCPNSATCNSLTFTCNAGFTVNSTGNGCTGCGPSSYKSTPSNDQCTPCPNDATCTSTAFTCNAGFGLSSNGNGCIQCGTTNYKPAAGNIVCLACPPNADCTSIDYQCRSGYAGTGNQCAACPPGTFKNTSGNAECRMCPQGMYQPQSAQTSCIISAKPSPQPSSVSSSPQPSSVPSSPPQSDANFWVRLWTVNPAAGIAIVTSFWIILVIVGFLSGYSLFHNTQKQLSQMTTATNTANMSTYRRRTSMNSAYSNERSRPSSGYSERSPRSALKERSISANVSHRSGRPSNSVAHRDRRTSPDSHRRHP